MTEPDHGTADDRREVYSRRLTERRASLADATRRHLRFGNLRLALVALGLVAAYAVFVHGVFSAWWLVALGVPFFWAGVRLDRAVTARLRLTRSVAFYERALSRLDGRWIGAGHDTGVRFMDDAHLYAKDLDLFGGGSLFELLNGARTRMGEETLASWLKAPAIPTVVAARHEAVVELATRVDLREDVAVLGEDTRAGVRGDALAAWGEQTARLDSAGVPWWAWPLSAAGAIAAAGLFIWFVAELGLIGLDETTRTALRIYVLTVFTFCGAVTWRVRARTEAILRGAHEAARDLELLAGVLGRLEGEQFAAARLSSLRADLEVDGQPPSARIARLDALMSLEDSRHHLLVRLLGPLVLWDLHLVYAVERWRRTSGPSLGRWLDAVGEMDALLSLAAYRFEHPDDVFPEIGDGAPCFEGEGLGHPLIAGAAMIRNDVHLAGDVRVLVVSGSNMSGKSTLLRAVGVNAVLAFAGVPVRARRLRLTPLVIGASIRTEDSLQAGVSRFYAEITRLGRIVRRSGDAPVLFLIDELLHGTNSHDRRIGAEAIVRGLVERGAIGLVTTHDLALAQVAEDLAPRAANVHFEDVIEHGRIRFDYLLRPGVVRKSNALELMRSVGLDV